MIYKILGILLKLILILGFLVVGIAGLVLTVCGIGALSEHIMGWGVILVIPGLAFIYIAFAAVMNIIRL